MNQLQRVVSGYLAGLSKAGAGAASPVDREALQAELRRLSRQNQTFFVVLFLAVVAVFLVALWFAVRSRDDPAAIQNAFAASGISVVGAITWMTRLWTKKVKIDLLYTLAGRLSEDALRATLESLVKGL